ncbi:MAG: alpha/beta fold hydrolase [Oceanicaulis sp.]
MDKWMLILIGAIVLLGLAGLWLWTPDLPREKLEAKYLEAPSDVMTVADARLHVRVDGPQDAPAVILIHGFGASLHTWEDWAQAMAGAFRVVRFDLPGAGLSPPDPTGRYDDARAFELVSGLMDALSLERAALVGNSVGGRISWSYAAEHPDRVTRLVLISPDGFASAGFEYGEAPDVGRLTHAMRVITPRFLVRQNLVASYGDPDRLSDETVARYHDLLRARGARRALIHRMEQTVLTDPRPILETIDTPTLLLWGEEDGLIPVSNAQDYLDHLPNAELVTLDGVGHLPQEEAPERSLEPVRDFLAPLKEEEA